MGKTSVYLTDDMIIRWHASRVSLTEVVRRGLDAIEGLGPPVDEATLTRVLRAEMAGASFAAGSTPARYEPDSVRYEPFEDSA